MNSYEYLGKLLKKKKDLELKIDYLRSQSDDKYNKKARAKYFDILNDLVLELRKTKQKIDFVYNLKGEIDSEIVLHKKNRKR